MARFFLPARQIEGHRATITGVELNHLRRVLRLRTGDRVVLFDDADCEHEGIIRSLSEDRGEIEIIRSYQVNNESPLKTILALGLTKGEKMDWVVEKATELGVHSVIPFVSSYTIPKLDEKKVAQRSERWQKIALSAAPDLLDPGDEHVVLGPLAAATLGPAAVPRRQLHRFAGRLRALVFLAHGGCLPGPRRFVHRGSLPPWRGTQARRTADELLGSRNFGVTSLNEIRGKLAELGLKLRND